MGTCFGKALRDSDFHGWRPLTGVEVFLTDLVRSICSGRQQRVSDR